MKIYPVKLLLALIFAIIWIGAPLLISYIYCDDKYIILLICTWIPAWATTAYITGTDI